MNDVVVVVLVVLAWLASLYGAFIYGMNVKRKMFETQIREIFVSIFGTLPEEDE